MSLLVQRYLNRTHAAELLAQSCQSEMLDSRGDVEEVLNECVDLAELTRHACESALSNLYNHKVSSAEALGCEDSLRIGLQRTTDLFRTVDSLLKKVRRPGFALESESSFKRAIREVEELGNRLAMQWPAVDSTMIEESKAAIGRGDYQLAEERLHGLQGGGPQND